MTGEGRRCMVTSATDKQQRKACSVSDRIILETKEPNRRFYLGTFSSHTHFDSNCANKGYNASNSLWGEDSESDGCETSKCDLYKSLIKAEVTALDRPLNFQVRMPNDFVYCRQQA